MRKLLIPALAAVMVLSACGGTSSTGTSGYVSGDGLVTTVDPSDRHKAPIIEGTDLDGNKISTADYSGEVLVVNLWGSWCPPCRKEAPILVATSKAYADKNTQFIGVLSDDNQSSAKAFADQQSMTYPTIMDPDGSRQLALASVMPAPGLPTTWIIDSKGRMAARYAGALPSKATLTGLINYVKETS
jgi:thiol-disulfide isomerase/thioredoxin